MVRSLLVLMVVWTTASCKSQPNTNQPSSATVEEKVESSMVTTSSDSSAMAPASKFLALLNQDQRKKATFTFDDNERFNFNFVPMARKGLTLDEMDNRQREALFILLQAALSDQGMKKVQGIRNLEIALKKLENQPANSRYRDPDIYYISIFGEPSSKNPWGWRFEGHHLSLNFSSVSNQVSATPTFMGSNPGTLARNDYPGSDLLKSEEFLAKKLLGLLDPPQLGKATYTEQVPREIITGNSRKVSLSNYEGLPFKDMKPDQQSVLVDLLMTYLNNMESTIANSQWEQIKAEGLDNLWFAWAGGVKPYDGHYYRIHGPSVLIEYDNTQNNGNHIHTVWRDLKNDFGEDLLKKHYETSGHH